MPFGLGIGELVLIFLVILLLFGAKRLPDMAKGLGKGIREFKKSVKDTTDELKVSVDDDDTKKDSGSKSNKDVQ